MKKIKAIACGFGAILSLFMLRVVLVQAQDLPSANQVQSNAPSAAQNTNAQNTPSLPTAQAQAQPAAQSATPSLWPTGYWGPILSCSGSPSTTEAINSKLPPGQKIGTCWNFCDVVSTFQRLLYVAISVAIFMVTPVLLMIGAFRMFLSGGNPGTFKKGQSMIVDTAIGVAIILSSFLIVNTFLWAIGAKVNSNGSDNGEAAVSWPTIKCDTSFGSLSADYWEIPSTTVATTPTKEEECSKTCPSPSKCVYDTGTWTCTAPMTQEQCQKNCVSPSTCQPAGNGYQCQPPENAYTNTGCPKTSPNYKDFCHDQSGKDLCIANHAHCECNSGTGSMGCVSDVSDIQNLCNNCTTNQLCDFVDADRKIKACMGCPEDCNAGFVGGWLVNKTCARTDQTQWQCLYSSAKCSVNHDGWCDWGLKCNTDTGKCYKP